MKGVYVQMKRRNDDKENDRRHVRNTLKSERLTFLTAK